MKKALVLCAQGLAEEYSIGDDYEFLLNVHDEYQIGCKWRHAVMIGEIAAQAISDAGEYYGFRCPLDAEYEVGVNWSETH